MTAQKQHTPGPWTAIIPETRHIHEGSDITNYTVYSKLSRGELIKDGHTHYRADPDCVDNVTICNQFLGDMTLEEMKANAHLIAAAPATARQRDDLSKLLRGICQHLDGGGTIIPENGVHRAIRAAISNVEKE